MRKLYIEIFLLFANYSLYGSSCKHFINTTNEPLYIVTGKTHALIAPHEDIWFTYDVPAGADNYFLILNKDALRQSYYGFTKDTKNAISINSTFTIGTYNGSSYPLVATNPPLDSDACNKDQKATKQSTSK